MASQFTVSRIFLGAAALLLTGIVSAQSFPVRIERTGANGVCDNMTANRMAVDPVTGRVTLQGVTGMTCLPDGAAGLGNVDVAILAGPHASGATTTATVQNIPAGATCTLRGIANVDGAGIIGGDGWADGTPLCSACPTSVTRTLGLTNVSVLSNWVFQLNVQCSIQSGGYSVQAPIESSIPVTVSPAPIVEGSCPFGENVPPISHDGLSIANRQTQSFISNPSPSGIRDVTTWTSLFGTNTGGLVWPRTLPSPGPASLGYGFPGTNISQFYYRMDRGKFIALKFRAPQPDAQPQTVPLWTGISSGMNTYSAPVAGAPVTFAIAPCPGQFRSVAGASLPPQCVTPDPNSTKMSLTFIVVDPNIPYTGAHCPLEAGKTYYWNIIAADHRTNLQTSFCPSTFCEHRMSRNPLSPDQNYP